MNILNKKTGFTLMEILITVIIISLLAAAGIPYYKDHIERQKAALGITNLRMIADSLERYMALHGETIPTNLASLDSDIDRSKLSSDHTVYNDGGFTFTIQNNNGVPVVEGQRNTGEYTLSFSLGDDEDSDANYGLTCTSSDPDICSDTLGL